MEFDRYASIEVWNRSTGQSLAHPLPDYMGGPRCSSQSIAMSIGDDVLIKGIVYDMDRRPMPNAKVDLYVGACGGRGGGYLSTTETNKDGYYEFAYTVGTDIVRLASSSEDPTFFVHCPEGGGGYSGEVRISVSVIPKVALFGALAAVGLIVGMALAKLRRR